jgi:hypothetical protein
MEMCDPNDKGLWLMKRIGLILLLTIPLTLVAQEKIKLDIKVPLLETADLAPAQLGASLFLMRSDWATLAEVGEDATVWLKDYDRRKNFLGQQVITIRLEIRDPSLIRTGNLQSQQKLVVRYWKAKTSSERYDQEILNQLQDLSDDLQIEAYYVGRKIEEELGNLLK